MSEEVGLAMTPEIRRFLKSIRWGDFKSIDYMEGDRVRYDYIVLNGEDFYRLCREAKVTFQVPDASKVEKT